MTKIAPSILASDFGNLQEVLLVCESLNVDMIHLDIMDGHFVPNISFGPPIVSAINSLTEQFLDVHLMLSEPEFYFRPFKEAGADLISFHIEVHPDPVKYAVEIHNLGLKAGIALNPKTDIETVLPFLSHFELLLIMSVNPGFAGQEFIETAYEKTKVAREHIKNNNLTTEIEIDGGVNQSNARKLVESGADILVMGTAFFKAQEKKELIEWVQSL